MSGILASRVNKDDARYLMGFAGRDDWEGYIATGTPESDTFKTQALALYTGFMEVYKYEQPPRVVIDTKEKYRRECVTAFMLAASREYGGDGILYEAVMAELLTHAGVGQPEQPLVAAAS